MLAVPQALHIKSNSLDSLLGLFTVNGVYVFMSLFTGEAPRLAVERGWLVGGLCWLRVCSLHDIQRRAAPGNTR